MRKIIPFLPVPDLATPVLGMSILPAWIGMLLLLAVVVTFTRTSGAILLTVASAMSHDIYVKFLRPAAREREKVIVARLSVLCFGAIPVFIALRRLDLVNFVVLFAVQLMACCFFVPVVIGLNWRRGTRAGAVSAILGGAAGFALWVRLAKPFFWGLDPAEAGILFSVLLFLLVSVLTKPVPERCLGLFFPPVADRNGAQSKDGPLGVEEKNHRAFRLEG
jgi:Na+/proline symporter